MLAEQVECTMVNRSETNPGDVVYAFGPFLLSPSRQLLLRAGIPVKLGGKAFEMLRLLVQRAGELVSKDELMAFAWPRTVVHESNLKVNMSILRRSLADVQTKPRYIATVTRRGYRFVAPVSVGAINLAMQSDCEAPYRFLRLPESRDIVGREADIASILASLRRDPHVTLVGTGGVGKTAVAIAVGHALQADYNDGACLIDLSTIDDPMLVPATVAKALGLRSGSADTLTAVIDYLRQRRIFLLLDSCEHVQPMAALFAQRLAAAGGESKLLATSRAPLGYKSERSVRLHSLSFPVAGDVSTAEQVRAFPAVELFARRAMEWSAYELVEADYAAVASICRLLDGLPLAIELAASKLERYTPQELRKILGRHCDVLWRNAPTLPPRQQTLWATIDWSYRLLTQDESTLFSRVSVFAGAFELEDAVAVAESKELDAGTIAACLGGLISKSLLVAEVSGAGLRYRLTDSARRYAAERLREDPLAAQVHQRHEDRIFAPCQ